MEPDMDEFEGDHGPTLEEMEALVPHCDELWEIELPEAVTSLCMTPKGKLAAAATIDDEIVIFDTSTGEIKFRLAGHAGGTNAVQFLSGSVLISCGEDGKVKIWNVARQAVTAEFKVEGVDADRTPDGHTVSHLTISPESTRFAVASGRTVSLFSISSLPATVDTVKLRTFPPLASTVEGLRFDKTQGNLMAAYNGGVTMWDLASRSESEAQALDFTYNGACLSVDGSPDMTYVVTGCHDASVHIFHLMEKEDVGVEIEQMTCAGYEKAVKFVDFDHSGHWMASSGGTRGTIWDFSNSPNGSVPTLTVGHMKTITCQAWQPDEPFLLATGAKDGRVYFHDVEQIAERGEPNICLPGVVAPCKESDEATALVWGLDGLLVVGHVSGKIRGLTLPEESSSEEEEEEEEEEIGGDKKKRIE